MVYGYLRVSSDKQDVESQKIGVVKKAEELHIEVNEWIKDEGVSGVKEYNKRQLGVLMEKMKTGDIIIVSEISRLARSVFMLFRIVEFCVENNVIIYSVKDSISMVKKGELTGIMMVFCFGIAAQIEREMIIKRTVEGLERRKRDGVLLGRQAGYAARKKLDGKDEEIKGYIAAGLSNFQIGRLLHVHRSTLTNYCRDKGIELHPQMADEILERTKDSRWRKQGAEADAVLNAEKENIIAWINSGLTPKYILEKLQEKGYTLSAASLRRWLRYESCLYDFYVQKNKEIRSVRNVDCGKYKNNYK
jgi:DNA invertase Pin-like site-specific DNA recombinase